MINLNIDHIGSNTIKVILTEEELEDYDITYEKLNKNSLETKQLLLDIIESIRIEENIDLVSRKLFIEAFPQKKSGCVLYITILSEKEESKELYADIICIIENINTLISLASKLFRDYSHIIKQSTLYNNEQVYILKITTYTKMKKRISNILNEFSQIVPSDEITKAYISEHSKLSIENDALECLSELC